MMARARRHTEKTSDHWPTNGPGHRTASGAIEAVNEPAVPTPSMVSATVLEAESAAAESAASLPAAPLPQEEPRGTVYQHQSLVDVAEFADFGRVLGVPRQPIRDIRWARTQRRFGRAMVWTLPVAVVALTLSSIWGWPTPTSEPSGASPGGWLFWTALGFGLWLVALVAIAALLATTPGRIWAAAAVIASTLGAALLLPVAGVVGLARPAVTRISPLIGTDAAGSLESQFFDGTVTRWLAIGGMALLAVGALALGGAILGSDVLNRLDGWLCLVGVAVAFVGAYLSWEFLLTVAGMAFLAAALGVAWNASRLTVDGRISDSD